MSRHQTYKYWTADEETFLREHAAEYFLGDLALKLQRPKISVRLKLSALKLPYKCHSRLWTAKDHSRLFILAETRTAAQIAKKMGRTKIAVKDQLYRLGVKLFAGRYSLYGAAAATGYDPYQFTRARKALGQKWQHVWTNGRNRCLITEDQFNALTEYLRTETYKRAA